MQAGQPDSEAAQPPKTTSSTRQLPTVSAGVHHEPMNDTEQLLTVVEKTAHITPRREKRLLPAARTTEDVARAAAPPGFPPPPLPTALRNRITDGGRGPERELLPLTGGPALSGQQSLVALLDGSGWYGEDLDDDAPELQPWPDYNART